MAGNILADQYAVVSTDYDASQFTTTWTSKLAASTTKARIVIAYPDGSILYQVKEDDTAPANTEGAVLWRNNWGPANIYVPVGSTLFMRSVTGTVDGTVQVVEA